jgi:2-polyprenyl-3-methyl-5-hydroxy-6-metoxy-1,4-benzoquinol methylase
VLTTGNTAKLYCLERIAALAAERGPLTILDLGCGVGANFSGLLTRHPDVTYVGVDTDAEACAAARVTLSGFRAEIVCGSAYGLDRGQFDVVASLSVLEHIRDRRAYIETIAKSLRPNGRAYLIADNGHFVDRHPRELLKTTLGRARALTGSDRWYQAFVREDEVRGLLAGAGLDVLEARSFNSSLKDVYRHVPPEGRDLFMRRWLDAELAVEDAGVDYDDSLASSLRTRYFELRRA